MTSADALPRHWNLYYPALIAETFSSRIWRVKRDDGSSAVVKALKPFDDVEDELRGAHYLRWRDGQGAVRLFDMHEQSMLLEDAGNRLLVDELNERDDDAATAIAAEVMARLFSPSDRPSPADLQPLRERFRSLFKKAASDRKAGKDSLYVEAASIAEHLLDNPVATVPLHGDLHHDNVLFGPRGWLAIDPKGVLGDPGFDAANWFYNPLDRDDLCLDGERISFMAELFGKTLKQSPAAILDHAIAYGCLSASWHAEDGNTKDEERELLVAKAIRAVRFSF
ncbi:MAG: aminoglycoside phosphotransferase family protein [Rhizobiaceae bacterium]